MDRINKYDVLRKGCLSRDVLAIIGDKWTVLILHSFHGQPMRYSALQRAVDGISQKVLTATLRNLEKNGIITRVVFPVIPPKVEYSLTPLGVSLLDTLETLSGWAEAHAPSVEKARQEYIERQSSSI